MDKIVVAVGLLLIFITFLIGYYYFSTPKVVGAPLFQGPVRPTDDLEHFRRTGETIDG